MSVTTPPRSAFFYGTLMAPQVLHRVCHGSSSPDNPLYATHDLKTYPAILHSYRRHRVAEADYPAILPHPNSTVRGTYVTGLTLADIWRLDIFEGSEYTRQVVKPRLLTSASNNPEENVEGEEVIAETYVWTADPALLEDREWDFAEFQKEKMKFWVGAEGAAEYAGRPSIIGQLTKLARISKADFCCVVEEVDEAVAAAEEKKNDGTGGRAASGGAITKALQEKF